MIVCIPVTADLGPESPVCAHFGSAPMFMFVDVETGVTRTIANRNQHHKHGKCQPLAALDGESCEGVVVGGIGMGALHKLRAAKVRVFICEAPTVEEAMAALKAGTLPEAAPATACQGHGHGGRAHEGHGRGCAH